MSEYIDTATDAAASPPRALILCKDGRLSRFFETELAILGVTARAAESLPDPDRELCLLLADGDSFPLPDCVSLAEACGCPLLVFGREPVPLPLPPERGVYLRRPFAMTELDTVTRSLLSGLPAVGLPLHLPHPRPTPDTPPKAAPESPVRIAPDGTVTVAGKAVTLTPAERAIFGYLYDRQGEAVPREELSALLGGGGNSVDVYICHLRAKIEKPLGRRMILTARGVGYKLEL